MKINYLRLAKTMNPSHPQLQDVKPYKQRKPRAKGYKCDRAEDRLRPLVIKELKKQGFRVYRIENSICGKSSGITDLLVFGGKMWFIELKVKPGDLKGKQREFQRNCQRTQTNHMVIWSTEQVKDLI